MKRSISCNSSDSEGSCYKVRKITDHKKNASLDLRAPETTPDGQLVLNPTLTMEEATLFAKREYNRRNAARARSRSKGIQSNLQKKVYRLVQDTERLSREKDNLEKLVLELQMQNRQLICNKANQATSDSYSLWNDANDLSCQSNHFSKDYQQQFSLQSFDYSRSINNDQQISTGSVKNAMFLLGFLSADLQLGIQC